MSDDDDKLLQLHMTEDRVNFARMENALITINGKLDSLISVTSETKTESKAIAKYLASIESRVAKLEVESAMAGKERVKLSERLAWPAIITSMAMSAIALALKLLA